MTAASAVAASRSWWPRSRPRPAEASVPVRTIRNLWCGAGGQRYRPCGTVRPCDSCRSVGPAATTSARTSPARRRPTGTVRFWTDLAKRRFIWMQPVGDAIEFVAPRTRLGPTQDPVCSSARSSPRRAPRHRDLRARLHRGAVHRGRRHPRQRGAHPWRPGDRRAVAGVAPLLRPDRVRASGQPVAQPLEGRS